MRSEDLLQGALFGLFVITGIVALVNGFVGRVSRVDRFVPIFLQLCLLVLMFMPLLHGFPSEWFSLLVLTAIWSLGAAVFSFRLYRSGVIVSRVLGISQFVECLTALFAMSAGYVSSCYTFYGHFVLRP